ncbi:(+)-neomenthol dehydrogenase-like isoform X2 [Lolium rigidum]|uniref:(+)-neomenthol dehydrogenase-like isoform X2 n=1 Tax=Lolium rigidum TaxID=89674 RepID=UPI001F5D263C|nr:(+)-neomenthol dehydrogenase-like isoform X2 [Lolium rigidum]
MEGAMSSSPNSRIALVTGGNKGIGLEVCKQLASNGITVVLTARDQARGTAAVQELNRLGFSDVIFHQLDITDALSIARLVDFLKNRFERLDILLNNAAIGGTERPPLCGSMPVDKKFDGMDKNQRLEWLFKNCRETYQATKQCLQTNYYGTKQVTEALLPLLQCSPDGRIVNVSSSVGLLRQFRNEELTQELNDIDQLTEKRLDELLDMFLKDFEAGRVQVRGWPAEFPAYKVAKAAMNAYSRILARRHPALCVNCADPGFTSTDMTLNTGVLTPDEGAGNIVRVALLPDGELTGAYFQEGQQASFL